MVVVVGGFLWGRESRLRWERRVSGSRETRREWYDVWEEEGGSIGRRECSGILRDQDQMDELEIIWVAPAPSNDFLPGTGALASMSVSSERATVGFITSGHQPTVTAEELSRPRHSITNSLTRRPQQG
jgi:hypothetical protein